ncbi:MAG: phospholipid scramblase-related protein [Mycobacteriales bacterium]
MTTPQAGWYPDPTGSFHHRWWDGQTWTDNVATNGQQSVSPMNPGAAPVQASSPHQLAKQAQRAGLTPGVGPAGGGTVFTEPVLVVNQKAKLIEVSNQYSVYDQNGTQVASVSEIGQSMLKKVVRVLGEYDQYFTHRLEVRDMSATPILHITRPAKFIKSKVIVEKPGVGEVGRLVQQNAIGKIRFGLMAGDRQVGELRAENWRAWDFAIVNEAGTEVARIKKTFEGLAKTMFTTADNYVVRIHQKLEDPLLSLVVASALTVDTALKQDSRGLS